MKKSKVESTEMAEVFIKLGSTINMGNFESIKVDVGLSLPCKPTAKEIKKTFEHVFKTTQAELKDKIYKVSNRKV